MSQPQPLAKHSWRTALQRIAFARTSLEAQLYPPLERKVTFRPYQPEDFECCLAIYRKNEPGRFPADVLDQFGEYLKDQGNAFIVAELESRVVGFGGLTLAGENVGVLVFGMLKPEFQCQRIGSTLIMLRLLQIPAGVHGVFALILAVEASIPIYRRFGFIDRGSWKSKDGAKHPFAILRVSPGSLKRIKRILDQRGIKLEGTIAPPASDKFCCEVQTSHNGRPSLHFKKFALSSSPDASA